MVVVDVTFKKSSLIESPNMQRVLSRYFVFERLGASCVCDGGDELHGGILCCT